MFKRPPGSVSLAGRFLTDKGALATPNTVTYLGRVHEITPFLGGQRGGGTIFAERTVASILFQFPTSSSFVYELSRIGKVSGNCVVRVVSRNFYSCSDNVIKDFFCLKPLIWF